MFTVFGKITGDILAEVAGITVGLFAAVDKINDIREHTLWLSCTDTGLLITISLSSPLYASSSYEVKFILRQLRIRFQGVGSRNRWDLNWGPKIWDPCKLLQFEQYMSSCTPVGNGINWHSHIQTSAAGSFSTMDPTVHQFIHCAPTKNSFQHPPFRNIQFILLFQREIQLQFPYKGCV